MRFPYILGLFFVYLLLVPYTIHAAQITLDSEIETQNHLDTFYVPIRIDTQGECVNAVKVAIAYDPTQISVKDVATGDSVLSLWIQVPTIQKLEGKEIGRVVFEGGIPGGYCGRVVGDPGQTNILAKLVVTGLPLAIEYNEIKTTQIVVEPGTKVYVHDGNGSEAPLTFKGLELALAHSTSSPKNVWLSDVKADAVAPEDFEIIFVEGPSAGDGRHYIVFNTTDKQSGIDHYEVLETDPDKFGFLTWVPKQARWVVATSPYVLRDQNLHSKILVKAVDKNGNERIREYSPEMSLISEIAYSYLPFILLIGFFVIVIALVLRYKKRKAKLKKGSE